MKKMIKNPIKMTIEIIVKLLTIRLIFNNIVTIFQFPQFTEEIALLLPDLFKKLITVSFGAVPTKSSLSSENFFRFFDLLGSLSGIIRNRPRQALQEVSFAIRLWYCFCRLMG